MTVTAELASSWISDAVLLLQHDMHLSNFAVNRTPVIPVSDILNPGGIYQDLFYFLDTKINFTFRLTH